MQAAFLGKLILIRIFKPRLTVELHETVKSCFLSSIFSSLLQRLEMGYCLLELVIALQFDEPRSPDALFFSRALLLLDNPLSRVQKEKSITDTFC